MQVFCHSGDGLMEAVLEQITRTLGKQIQNEMGHFTEFTIILHVHCCSAIV